jgi:hypothetical protein
MFCPRWAVPQSTGLMLLACEQAKPARLYRDSTFCFQRIHFSSWAVSPGLSTLFARLLLQLNRRPLPGLSAGHQ